MHHDGHDENHKRSEEELIHKETGQHHNDEAGS